MAHLMNTPNVYFVLRVKHNHSAMREIARLPMLELDCDIAFTISTTQTNEDKRNRHIYLPQPKKSKPGSTTRRARWDFPSPYTMRLRIVRFQLDNGNFETLATSLPRSFTVDDLKEIYPSNPAGTAGRAKPSGEGLRLVHIPHCGLKNGGRGLIPPPPPLFIFEKARNRPRKGRFFKKMHRDNLTAENLCLRLPLF